MGQLQRSQERPRSQPGALRRRQLLLQRLRPLDVLWRTALMGRTSNSRPLVRAAWSAGCSMTPCRHDWLLYRHVSNLHVRANFAIVPSQWLRGCARHRRCIPGAHVAMRATHAPNVVRACCADAASLEHVYMRWLRSLAQPLRDTHVRLELAAAGQPGPTGQGQGQGQGQEIRAEQQQEQGPAGGNGGSSGASWFRGRLASQLGALGPRATPCPLCRCHGLPTAPPPTGADLAQERGVLYCPRMCLVARSPTVVCLGRMGRSISVAARMHVFAGSLAPRVCAASGAPLLPRDAPPDPLTVRLGPWGLQELRLGPGAGPAALQVRAGACGVVK